MYFRIDITHCKCINFDGYLLKHIFIDIIKQSIFLYYKHFKPDIFIRNKISINKLISFELCIVIFRNFFEMSNNLLDLQFNKIINKTEERREFRNFYLISYNWIHSSLYIKLLGASFLHF